MCDGQILLLSHACGAVAIEIRFCVCLLLAVICSAVFRQLIYATATVVQHHSY